MSGMFLRPYRNCYYCRCPMDTTDPMSFCYPTKDHKIPKSRGGKGNDNIVWCCRNCNQTKGNMTGAEFKSWIKAGRPNKVAYMRDLGLIQTASEEARKSDLLPVPKGRTG